MAQGTKKLERRHADALAAILRPIMDERFDGNQTRFAKAAGVSQSQMSAIMRTGGGDRSVGINVLIRLREYLGTMTIDEMLGLPPLPARPVPVSEIQQAVQSAMDLAIQRLRQAEGDGAPPPRPLPAPLGARRKKPD